LLTDIIPLKQTLEKNIVFRECFKGRFLCKKEEKKYGTETE